MNYFESWLFEIINQCNAPLCFSDRSINVDFGTLWHHRSTKVKTFKYFRGDTSFNAYWTQYNRLKQIKSRAKAAGISVQQLWLCVCATLSVSTTEIWQRMSVCVFLNWKLKKMHRARVCLCVTICVFERWCARTYRVWNGAERFRLQLQLTATLTHTHTCINFYLLLSHIPPLTILLSFYLYFPRIPRFQNFLSIFPFPPLSPSFHL